MASLGDWIAVWAREGLGGAISDNASTLDNAAQQGGDTAQKGITGYLGDGVGTIFGLLDPFLGVVAGVLGWLQNTGKWVRSIGEGWALGSFFSEASRPLYLPILHAVADAEQTEIHDPNTAARLVTKRLIDSNFGHSEAAGGNLDGGHFQNLINDAYTIPGVPDLLELWRRGLIDANTVAFAIERLGIDPHFADVLPNLATQLLGAPDLALALLRGNIDQADAEHRASLIGVDATDLEVLVGNTGEPPGLMELLEAYRRDFIDQSRLERGIKQSRVRDEWIDVVEKLRFSPMSTADAVRAVVENYISSDEGKGIAEQNGLNPDHWDTLVQSWGRPLAHEQMGSLVHRGLATREQFDQAMRESDIKNKYVDLSFDLTERLLPERQIVSAIRYGATDLETGSRLLLQLGYSRENAAILLKLGLREQHTQSHELTRAQIGQLYANGVLHRADAKSHLIKLGYSDQDATYMLDLIDTQQHAKEIRAETSVIRTSYLAGGIDSVHAENELRQLGLSTDNAQHLIQLWDREKRRAAKTLSVTQIVKAVKHDALPYDQGLALLEAAGYSKDNAVIVFASNGIVAG